MLRVHYKYSLVQQLHSTHTQGEGELNPSLAVFLEMFSYEGYVTHIFYRIVWAKQMHMLHFHFLHKQRTLMSFLRDCTLSKAFNDHVHVLSNLLT